MRRRFGRLIGRIVPGQDLAARIVAARPRLYRIAWSWCHDDALAEDLVQDTLARALESLSGLRDPQRLDVWLTRILVNRHRDHHRRPRIETGFEDDRVCEADRPDQAVHRQDLVERTRAAISRLNDDQRQVLTLVDMAGYSYADTARILDLPIGTVMSRLARARGRLKDLLAADLMEGEVPGRAKHPGSRERIVPLRRPR